MKEVVLNEGQLKELQGIAHDYVTDEESLNELRFYLELTPAELTEGVRSRIHDATNLIYISHGTTSSEVRTLIRKKVKKLDRQIRVFVQIACMKYDYDSSDFEELGNYDELVKTYLE